MLGKRLAQLDPVLALALGLALTFSLYGITWGRVECWNPDQMAMRGLHAWFLPFSYQKPPLHTYLNEHIVLRPIALAERLVRFAWDKRINLNEARLLGSRSLVVFMYLGTVYLAYRISRDAFGLFSARIIALLFATSAGFIAYNHFLTCDSPLLLFMVFAMFLAMRVYSAGHLVNYVMAGFSVGVCATMKYNGLAVGVAIVVVHFLSKHRKGLASVLFDRRLIAGLFAVPIGFVAGNPGALFKFRKFADDYIYNAKVTPHYGGVMQGQGYLKFLERIPEIIGLPGAILIAAAAISSLIVLFVRRDFRSPGATCFAMAASVFLFYFAAIGSFPRMESRFVLPAVPFLILMAGPFLQTIATKRRWIYSILVPLLLYNALCCLLVGKRFASDPRMGAQRWLENHARAGLVIESSSMSPHWARLPRLKAGEIQAANPNWERAKGVDAVDWRMPYAFGRLQLFKKIFHDDPWIQEHVAQYEIEADERLYSRDELLKRHPGIVTVHSIDYSISNSAVRSYYSGLLEGRFPYEIAFDRQAIKPPRWTYPRNIDFLDGRMTILKRRPDA